MGTFACLSQDCSMYMSWLSYEDVTDRRDCCQMGEHCSRPLGLDILQLSVGRCVFISIQNMILLTLSKLFLLPQPNLTSTTVLQRHITENWNMRKHTIWLTHPKFAETLKQTFILATELHADGRRARIWKIEDKREAIPELMERELSLQWYQWTERKWNNKIFSQTSAVTANWAKNEFRERNGAPAQEV